MSSPPHWAAALVEGLAADAGEVIRRAVAAVTSAPAPDAASAPAHLVLTLRPVGGRYRTLVGLARRRHGANRFRDLLAPVRDTVTGIHAHGQRQGTFRTGVPPGPFGRALEAQLLALLDSVNAGVWADDGTCAATAALIAAGADPGTASSTVHRVRGTDRPSTEQPRGKTGPLGQLRAMRWLSGDRPVMRTRMPTGVSDPFIQE